MNGDVLKFAQVMTVIVLSVAAFLAIGIGAWKAATSGSRSKSKGQPSIDESRFERLEAAVDAIAIEVERISESQRFAVGLLAERLPAARNNERAGELAPVGTNKRANTPH